MDTCDRCEDQSRVIDTYELVPSEPAVDDQSHSQADANSKSLADTEARADAEAHADTEADVDSDAGAVQEELAVSVQELVESLAWISTISSPVGWSHPMDVASHATLLIPENPLVYLWWLASVETGQLMIPALWEDSKIPDEWNSLANASLLKDSALFSLTSSFLPESGVPLAQTFLRINKAVVDKMQAILKRAHKYPLLRFYNKHVRNWEALINTLDTQLLITRITIRDVIYSASVLASEYLMTGQSAASVPECVQARLESRMDFYDTFPNQTMQIGLITLNPNISLNLIPVSLWLARHKQFSSTHMEDFALSGAIPPLKDPQAHIVQHQTNISRMLLREASQPLPNDLAAWKEKADRIVKIGTMIFKPFYDKPWFKYERVHERIYESMHVNLLDSLKDVVSRIYSSEDQTSVFTRLEFDPVRKSMVYLVYCMQKTPAFDEVLARFKEAPFFDRWTFYYQKSWTKRVLEWIPHTDETDRSSKLIFPGDLLYVSPLMRMGWWVEEHLRAILQVQHLDISCEWDPLLGASCVSFVVPPYVTWDKSFSADLAQLMDSTSQE